MEYSQIKNMFTFKRGNFVIYILPQLKNVETKKRMLVKMHNKKRLFSSLVLVNFAFKFSEIEYLYTGDLALCSCHKWYLWIGCPYGFGCFHII